ncbi:L-carnitine dehydratase/bile acid-inducible protein F [Novosphingobium resinovorum]|uniref:L-carnitine dehydratase/bile acid-inducible protein F n=1 Tax=Novosphingobium resinovorum TaxID=158500 RepID=A0A031JRD4_9SPHN|nr:CaiB/BaiF CoA-transferase family protein [Novosphingobium resinovorum]EZP79333.1 L-carnitine dehydratase/bile acid-inducible protein F [Novosphingobium resinovorum]
MAQGILSGLTVIDLTQNVAGPFCSQVLGDLGATVIKVERPGSGDDTRAWSPPSVGRHSSTFLALNRNKSSICVDIDSIEGRKLIADLVATADIFIHSMKPGSAERRGLGWDDLRKINPKLVYSAISAFGSSGPLSSLPGYDPLMQAFTGVMSTTGNEGEDPVRVGVSLIDMGTGMWAAIGILSSLLARVGTGEGANVEASLLDTGVGWMSVFVSSFGASGEVPRKMGSAMAMTAPYELFTAADGSVFIAAGNDRLFAKVCGGLGALALSEDPRFKTNPERVHHRHELHAELSRLVRTRPVAEVVACLRAAGAPCSEMNTVDKMLTHPQIEAAGIVRPLPVADCADHRVVALPVKIGGARGARFEQPPELGADTDSILARLGYDPKQVAALRASGAIA